MLFDGLKIRRMQRQWKKRDRKDVFTWVHRYLRLHSQEFEDRIYQDMLEYHRKELIKYLRHDLKSDNLNDEQLGELIDGLADLFNKFFPERVNAYKSLVDYLYSTWHLVPSEKTNTP